MRQTLVELELYTNAKTLITCCTTIGGTADKESGERPTIAEPENASCILGNMSK